MTQSELLQFGDIQSINQLELFAQQSVQEGDDPVRALTFIAEQDPITVFQDYHPSGFTVEIEDRGEFTKLLLTRRIEHSNLEDGYRLLEGEVYLISHDESEIYTAFTIDEDDFYKKGLRSYITSLPAAVSLSYLTTKELRGFFDVLEEQVDGTIIAEEAVIKSPSAKTDILYIKDPYYNLFNSQKVNDGDYYVDKVKFSVRGGRTAFDGFVTRNGDTRYSGGSSGIYFNYLLHNLGEAILKKGSIFEDKSREYGSRDAERLEIKYEPGTMRGTEANMELISALRDLNDSSLTVYHSNPYMHASILDFEDGTTADVFITSDQTISIIPGFEASRSSLTRICNHITESFQEGEITEGERTSRDFDDYFSG